MGKGNVNRRCSCCFFPEKERIFKASIQSCCPKQTKQEEIDHITIKTPKTTDFEEDKKQNKKLTRR